MRSFVVIISTFFSLCSCLFVVSCDSSAVLPEGGSDGSVVVSFARLGIANSTAVSTRSDVQLTEGVTVRILAYTRLGGSADPATDTFVAQNTYRVSSAGTLIPCIVDANGVVTNTTGSDMSLLAGNYDFYTVMPAVAVATASGEADILHGIDHAASLTGAVSITGLVQTVTLEVLERKCAKIEFEVRPTDDDTFITRVDIKSVVLTPLAETPQTVKVPGDIVPGAYNTAVTLGEAIFNTDVVTPSQASGEVVLLPCASGDVGLAMRVCLNGTTDPITLGPVTISSLALAKGYRYVFKVTLHAGRVYLEVSVKDWNDEMEWTTIVGSGPICSSGWESYGWDSAMGSHLLETNGWETIPGWDTSVGGNGPFSGIEWTINDWTTGAGQGLIATEWTGNSTDTSTGTGPDSGSDWTDNPTDTSVGNGAGNWADNSTDTSTGTGPDSGNGWTDNPTDTSVGNGAGNWTDNPTDTSVGNGAGNWTDNSTDTSTGTGPDSGNGWTNAATDTSVGNGAGNWTNAATDTSVGNGAGNWTSATTNTSVGNGAGNWISSSWSTDMGSE